MQDNINLCYDLLDIIISQEKTIHKQNEIISELTNENLEKENMISVLTQQEKYLY